MAQGETLLTVVGNLVADPELRYTPSGAAVANFRIASTPRTFDRNTNQWVDGDPLFLTCNVWREAAENVAETLAKGMRVIAQGRLRQRSYETREGEKRTLFELEVDDIGPSLKFSWAQVTRRAHPSQGGQGSGQPTGSQPSTGGLGQAQNNVAQGLGAQPTNDPWNTAPPAGGGIDDEPPF